MTQNNHLNNGGRVLSKFEISPKRVSRSVEIGYDNVFDLHNPWSVTSSQT
jgi:hypothetical protein